MFCPECNHNLHPISLKTRLNPVKLDYCSNCGGVWSDHGEINFVSAEDLLALKSLLPEQPFISQSLTLFCPKDRNNLSKFSGESIPNNLDVYRCNICGGVWFPKDNIFQFKNAQAAKIEYFKKWNVPLHSIYAILLPVLIVVGIGTGLLTSLVAMQKSTENRSSASVFFSNPAVFKSKNTVTLSFVTQTAATTKIYWWKTENEKIETVISKNLETSHVISLKNLEENTQYFYQIEANNGEQIMSSILTFYTQ